MIENVIETERLIIRKFTPDDWKDLYEYLSDEEVVKFEPYGPFSQKQSIEEAKYRSENKSFLAVCLKESKKLIGNLYLNLGDFYTGELGYVFNSKYWNKGYAFESTKIIIDYVFKNLDIRRIIAECNPKNIASWKLLERLNMRREGHLIQNTYFNVDENQEPIWQDTYLYAVLKSEWK